MENTHGFINRNLFMQILMYIRLGDPILIVRLAAISIGFFKEDTSKDL